MPTRGSLEDLNNQEQYLNFLLHPWRCSPLGAGSGKPSGREGPGLLGDKNKT